MKVVILAGGFGTRLSEETNIRPKPMVEVGNEPIIWHIMKIYSNYGYNDFIICAGYKQEIIKDYFLNYRTSHSDFEINFKTNYPVILNEPVEDWTVKIIDTGIKTMTGGRIKRIEKYVSGESFMLTYGDGLTDLNMNDLFLFHKKHQKAATVTAVKPVGRFGALTLDVDEHVSEFIEKPPGDGIWINGGFFVLEPDIFDVIQNDSTVWEQEPMTTLASNHQLKAFKHNGFWRPMDTMSDKRILEELWLSGRPPWRVW